MQIDKHDYIIFVALTGLVISLVMLAYARTFDVWSFILGISVGGFVLWASIQRRVSDENKEKSG